MMTSFRSALRGMTQFNASEITSARVRLRRAIIKRGFTAGLAVSLATPIAWAGDAEDAKAELQSLREQLKQLREEIQSIKGATATNAAAIKSVSDKAVVRSDLDALKDVTDEEIIRSVGLSGGSTSTPSGANKVNGNSHILNLTGFGTVGYTANLGPRQASTGEGFKFSTIGLTLSGDLRNDPAVDGNLNYALGLIATPNAKVASAVTVTTTPTLTTSNLTYIDPSTKRTNTIKVVTGVKTASSSTATTANASYINVGDAWVNYDIKTAKLVAEPDWTLSLKLGQYLLPYGLENPVGEAVRPTINQAQYIGKLGFGRDLGVTAVGGFDHRLDPPTGGTVPLIGYTLGLYNGSGPNTLDVNTGVDVLARVVLTPFPNYFSTFRTLQFGGNILEGNLGPSNGQLPTKRRYGADISWLRKPFLITGEYVHSDDGFDGFLTNRLNAASVVTQAAFQSSDNFVATVFWTPSTLPDFQPWVRFDRFDPTAYKNTTSLYGANIYSVGFNWYIWQKEPVTRRTYDVPQTERVVKLQVGYSYTDQEHYNPATQIKNQIDAALTFAF